MERGGTAAVLSILYTFWGYWIPYAYAKRVLVPSSAKMGVRLSFPIAARRSSGVVCCT